MTPRPPARQASLWASLRRAAVERMADAEGRWRSLGGLFGTGGLLALATLATPAEAGTDRLAILGLCGIAAVGAVTMIAGARRLPPGDGWIFLVLGRPLD